MGEVWSFLTNHIYLPILGGVLLLAVVCLLVVWLVCKWRNSRNYDYSALEHEMGLSERLRIEREQQYEAKRESALLNCQFYLRSMAGQYTMVEQLPNIGTRVNKDWFLVQDKRSKSTKLLTMSIRSSGCPIKLTKTNRKTLKEMLQLIHHPYLLPMDDVDFVAEQDLIVVVQHYNHNGSLKDIIYKSKPYQDVENKYSTVGYGLSLYQIQLYGKQVLEALIYLDDHGINIQGHVQSGNIIIENDTCRLCGYENILLGFTARSHHAIRRRLRDGKDGGDRLAFGMLLYEMCAGCELDTADPTERHLLKCQHCPDIIQILEFIFYNEKGKIPAFYKIRNHSFFKDVRLLQLERNRPPPMHFSSNMKSLIKQSQGKKKGAKLKPKDSRHQASSNPEDMVSTPPKLAEFLHTSGPAYTSPPSAPVPLQPDSGHIQKRSSAPTERSALLRSIEKGTKLKKTYTRFDPRV